MSWAILVIAGCLETTWALGLKHTDGFTRPVPTVLTLAAIVASMALLGFALRDLPVGTAYAVWVGIGVFGTAVAGMVFLGEPANFARVACLALLCVAIAGLKLTSAE